jgi:D-psicose/D-tagatose/L-ribulose 3-epimerase
MQKVSVRRRRGIAAESSSLNMRRRQFLAAALAAPFAARALSEAQVAQSCPNFRISFGVTQSGSYDPLVNTAQLARWGFDYCEPSVVKIMSLSDEEFSATRDHIAASGSLRVEAMNILLPGNMKVVGPSVDRAKLETYAQSAFARAEALGAKVVVFGSGGARKVPEGFSQTQAWSQLQDFLRGLGTEIDARNYSLVIGIEALRKAECNIVNTTAEAYQLSLDTNHPKIKIICDFFHLASEHEDPRILLRVKDRLVHLHFANACNQRAFPKDPAECPDYGPFFAKLRAINYQGRLSLEANTTNFESDAPVGLATLRQLYTNACVP